MKQPDQSATNKADDALPGASEVGQAYNALPKTEVPPELDAKVLARAHEAAGQAKAGKPDDVAKASNVVRLKIAALRRWAIPLTTAASVIVVMSVVYQMRFNTPHDAVLSSKLSMPQDSPAPATDELAPPPPPVANRAAKSAKPDDKAMADAPKSKTIAANAFAPPPVVVGPAAAPVITPIVPPAEVAVAPSPPAMSPAAPEPAAEQRMATVGELDKKQAESKAAAGAMLEDKASRNEAEQAKPSAPPPATQMLGMSTRRADASVSGNATASADAKPDLAALALVAGHYQYESYRIVKLSGEVQTMKDLGYAAATLDIDAQGTLTQSMTKTDGKVVTQTAKVIEVKLEGHSGHWVVLWSDLNYPVESTIMFDTKRLTSRTQYEYLSDTPRFGNVELAKLKRVPAR